MRCSQSLIAALTILIFAVEPLQAEDKIYRIVDEQGNITYTDEAPASDDGQVEDVEVLPPLPDNEAQAVTDPQVAVEEGEGSTTVDEAVPQADTQRHEARVPIGPRGDVLFGWPGYPDKNSD